MRNVIYNLAVPAAPQDWPPRDEVAVTPPGVPPLAPPRCWCERDLRKLNRASDTEKCVGCGLVSQTCTCKPLVSSA